MKNKLLKEYFGYDSYRPLQAEIIDFVLEKKDALVLMPTGGGKSICYQIPALVFDGLTIVISPLIALMKDQVEALRGHGIKASYLNSSLSQQENDAVLWAAKMGELKLLYIAPEKLFQGNLLDFFKTVNVSLIAVDEAHCISSWGHDFRPEYRQLIKLKDHFKDTPFLALTATADNVTRKDICTQLNIPEENTFLASFDRPNIALEVLAGRKRIQKILKFLETAPNQAGIIYCLSRKGTESVAANLKKNGFKANFYHAGLSAEKRNAVQESFIKDDIQIIVATIAFGMGIDKSNIRWVIHYNLPPNIESYYQEIGRAGRDASPAKAILFYSYSDIINRSRMINDGEQNPEQKALLHAKLDRMKQFAESNICRRRILISYFNEEVKQDCGNCDVCKNPRTRFDATKIAQKALSAIARTREQVAMGMLIDVLRGSQNQQIIKLGYNKLPTFAVGNNLKYDEWADYLSQLLNSGIMDIAYDENHNFKLNPVSWQVLKEGRTVELSEFIPFNERKALEDKNEPKTKKEVIKSELFELLRTLRKQLADSLGVPPYVIFHDTSLSEMATKRPITTQQFLDISGVGKEKCHKFGKVFIDEILNYVKANTTEGVRMAKGLTYFTTLELFKNGHSIEEIALERKMSASTIAGHLVKLKTEGENIDLKKLLDKWTYTQIIEGLEHLEMKPTDPIKPLFEHLGGDIDYGKIRIAMAIFASQK